MAEINPDATLIPDEAEVWIALKSEVADITDMIPVSPTADLESLGWDFVGLVNDSDGIPLTPSIEVKEYDGFGHPAFRIKAKKGKLKTGFTAFEKNAATSKFVLPGSAPNKIGAPKDIQIYVLYKYVDEDRTHVLVSLRPALAEVSDIAPIADGELSFTAKVVVHHTADAAGDVFQRVDDSSDDVTKTFTIDATVTGYTVTVDGDTTTSITTKTAYALQSTLRELASVEALPEPGVTVDGPEGGPLVAIFTGPVTTVTATGTGGTVTVA